MSVTSSVSRISVSMELKNCTRQTPASAVAVTRQLP
jgi:hypothetical protein